MEAWTIVRRLVLGVLWRRKGLTLGCFVVALVIAVPIAYVTSKEPPRFRTSASLILETRPDKVPIFQEFLPTRPVSVQMAILRSRTLAEAVIENLPKASLRDLLDNPYHIDYALDLKNWYRRLMGAEIEVESPQQRILKELRQARVSFATGADGIVNIAAEASKPQVAVDIVNAYVDALLAQTRSYNMDDARVSREFLEQQLAEVRKALKTTEDAMRAFIAANGGMKIPERAQTAAAQLAAAESALVEAESNRKMLETRLRGFRAKVEAHAAAQQKAEKPDGSKDTARKPAAAKDAQSAGFSPEIQRLRDILPQLERALIDLRIRYTDEHPRVQMVKQQIDEVRSQLGDALKDAPLPAPAAPGGAPKVASVLPSELGMLAEQVAALESATQAVTAQAEALRRDTGKLRDNLRGLSAAETEYLRLAREVESNGKLAAMLADKLAGARIREQGEMKMVKVIDPAGFPQPTTGQKRLTFLGGALALSIAAALVLPAGVEWIRKTVDTEDDVRKATGLPVLAILPHVPDLTRSADSEPPPDGRLRTILAMTASAARWTGRRLARALRSSLAVLRPVWRIAARGGRVVAPFARPVVRCLGWLARPAWRLTRAVLRPCARLVRRRRHHARGGLLIPPPRRRRVHLGFAATVRARVRRRLGRARPGDSRAGDFGARFMFVEALRRLRVAVHFAARSENLRTILIASAQPGEGKSTVVVNLARAFAEAGSRVVIADTDFERPTLHRALAVTPDRGLVDALEDRVGMDEAVVPAGDRITFASRGAALSPVGHSALATARLRDVMTDLGGRGELVLCDSAPVLLVPENFFIVGAVDAVILVARAGRTTCTELAAAKATLDDIGARVLGVVINETPASKLRSQYKRYYNAYMRSDNS